MVCTLATLSHSLFSGKGRDDWEALEGLRQVVGFLEGSLGLLSWDFRPWTVTKSSSLVEGATGGIAADAVLCGGGGGNFLLGLPFGPCSSSAWTSSSQETCLLPKGVSPPPWLTAVSPLPHTSMGTVSDLFSGGPFCPPYDVVILFLQPVDLKSLQKGGLGSFVGLPRPTLLSGFVGIPMGMEGSFTWLLHIIRRGLCPCEVWAVIQLLSLKDDFVTPPPGLDPLCIVVKVLEVVPMHLLIEVVQEG